jgi:hypothetical protein
MGDSMADDSKASAGGPIPSLHHAHGVLVTMPDDQVTVAIEMPPCNYPAPEGLPESHGTGCTVTVRDVLPREHATDLSHSLPEVLPREHATDLSHSAPEVLPREHATDLSHSAPEVLPREHAADLNQLCPKCCQTLAAWGVPIPHKIPCQSVPSRQTLHARNVKAPLYYS